MVIGRVELLATSARGDRAVVANLLDHRFEDVVPKRPIPAQRGVLLVQCGGDIAAEVHEAARSVDDGLVGHIALLGERRENQRLSRRRRTAPADLLDHLIR